MLQTQILLLLQLEQARADFTLVLLEMLLLLEVSIADQYQVQDLSVQPVTSVPANVAIVAGNNNGIGFWGGATGASGSYAIYMSAHNGTYGGRVTGDTTSDYNMYFKMTAGTNRGFVFKNGSTNVAGIDAAR